jgi:hypothetical protein
MDAENKTSPMMPEPTNYFFQVQLERNNLFDLLEKFNEAHTLCSDGINKGTHSKEQNWEIMEDYKKKTKEIIEKENELFGSYYEVPDSCGDTQEWIQKIDKFHFDVSYMISMKCQLLDWKLRELMEL